jgi:hypothetical protein
MSDKNPILVFENGQVVRQKASKRKRPVPKISNTIFDTELDIFHIELDDSLDLIVTINDSQRVKSNNFLKNRNFIIRGELNGDEILYHVKSEYIESKLVRHNGKKDGDLIYVSILRWSNIFIFDEEVFERENENNKGCGFTQYDDLLFKNWLEDGVLQIFSLTGQDEDYETMTLTENQRNGLVRHVIRERKGM